MKAKWYMLIVVVVFLGYLCIGCENPHIKRGKEQIELQNYEGVRNELASLLIEKPQHVEANYLMALSYYHEEQFSEAIEWVQKALTASPKHGDSQTLRAEIRQKGIEFLKASDLAVQMQGLNIVAEIPSAEAVPGLKAALESPNKYIWQKAELILQKIDQNALRTSWAAFLQHPNPLIKKHAAEKLWELEQLHEAAEILRPRYATLFLKGDDSAGDMLIALGTKESLPTLKEALRTDDEPLAVKAETLLEKAAPDVLLSEWKAMLSAPTLSLRERSAEKLWKSHYLPEAANVLRPKYVRLFLEGDGDAGKRLVEFGEGESIPELQKALGAKDESVAQQAELLLQTLAPEELRAIWVGLLENYDLTTRERAAERLWASEQLPEAASVLQAKYKRLFLEGDEEAGNRLLEFEDGDTIEILIEGMGARDKQYALKSAALFKELAPDDAEVAALLKIANNTLVRASTFGYVEAVELLLNYEVDINAFLGLTPLMQAAKNGHEDIVRLLLEHGADVDIQTSSKNFSGAVGWTALNFATLMQHEHIVAMLEEAGAEPIKQAPPQVSDPIALLEFAAGSGDPKLAELAFQQGANLNKSGESSALVLAVEQGHNDMVKFLMEQGAESKTSNSALFTGGMPLMFAASSGDMDILALSLKNGADVNSHRLLFVTDLASSDELFWLRATSSYYRLDGTALMVASDAGQFDAVKFLVENGADVNASSSTNHVTALMLAAYIGHSQIVEYLLAHGANANASSMYGKTAVSYALSTRNMKIARLLQQKAGISDEDVRILQTNEALLKAVREKNLADIASALERGADITTRESYTDSPVLHLAMSAGISKPETIQLLLDCGADPNETVRGETALSEAILKKEKGHKELTEVIKLLTQNGAKSSEELLEEFFWDVIGDNVGAVQHKLNNGFDINAFHGGRAFEGDEGLSFLTPLRYAIMLGHRSMQQLLLNNGAEISPSSGIARTFLDAAAKGDVDAVITLLSEGVDANTTNRYGDTAMMWAALGGYTNIVQLLLDHGGDANHRNAAGETALLWAVSGGHTEMVTLLIAQRVDIDAQPNFSYRYPSYTPLMLAITRGYSPIMEKLLGHGADANRENRNESPLSIAASHGYFDIIRMLLGVNVKVVFAAIKDLSLTPVVLSAIQNAALLGYAPIVKLLLSDDIVMQQRYQYDHFRYHFSSEDRELAIQLAQTAGHQDIVKLLEGEDVNLTVSSLGEFEVLDPACESQTECEGEYLIDLGNDTVVPRKEKLATMHVQRTGVVTDGVTPLLLRVKTDQRIKFVIDPPSEAENDSECAWGTLSRFDGSTPSCKSVTVGPGEQSGIEERDYTFWGRMKDDGATQDTLSSRQLKGYAVALYRAPANFPYEAIKKAELTIKAVALSTKEVIETKIELLPPPVVLVHGLWSTPEKWWYAERGGLDFVLKANGLKTYLVDYSKRSASTFNPQSSSYSIGHLAGKTNLALHDFRQKGIAISQVEVVGHSMGGLVTRARTVWTKDAYKKLSNYMRGSFHKIITIGTPHEGSPFGNVLAECKDVREPNVACEEKCKIDPGLYPATCSSKCPVICRKDGRSLAEWIELMGNRFEFKLGKMPMEQGVYDLQVGSEAIANIPQTQIYSHALVGTAPDALLKDRFLLSYVLGKFNVRKFDTSELTIEGILGKKHDAIVPQKSQQGGLKEPRIHIVEDVIHTDEPLSLEIQDHVLNLLLKEKIQLDPSTLQPQEMEEWGFFTHFPRLEHAQYTNCGSPNESTNEEYVSEASIQIEPTSGTVVEPGDTVQLQFAIAGGTSQSSAMFSIDGEIITVEGEPPYVVDYTVPANKSGTLEVYAETIGSSEEAYSFTSELIVLPKGSPSSLSVSREEVSLSQEYETYQLSVTGAYSDDRKFELTESVTGTAYATQSGTEDVISVSSEGLIEAHGDGQDAIIITNASHSVTVDVLVGDSQVSRGSLVSLRAAQDNIQLLPTWPTFQLQILGTYENGEEYDITSDAETVYTLNSGTEDVITVSAEGLVEVQTQYWDAEIITVSHSGHSIDVAVSVGFPPSLRQAQKFYSQKNYEEAAKLYWVLAEKGDRDAQYMLGVMYNWSKGVAQDTTMAIKWWQKASEQKDTRAQGSLAWIYATASEPAYQDGSKALEYALKATEQAEWLYDHDFEVLAAAYARNNQFEQAIESQEQAIAALEKVTADKEFKEQMKAQALERLELYKNHQAYTEEEIAPEADSEKNTSLDDYIKRLKAYQQHQTIVNAENESQNALAYNPVPLEISDEFLRYRAHGLFKAHGYSEAFPLYQKLSEQGDAEAKFFLGVMYRHGFHVNKDVEKAFRLWLSSAEQNYADAQNAVAAWYASNKDPKYQNGPKAIEYALKANEQKPEIWNFVGTLAVAYARNGQFEKAITIHKKATVLAQRSLPEGPAKDRLLEEDYAKRLELYRQHQAYVDETF